MKRIFSLALMTLTGLVASSGFASAGWANVFQVSCNDCQPRTSYSAPACPTPCPQPEARVSYVQRCYYQPVTEYKREAYYVPVKENVTSYYWEPVTSYSYTSYYDACSGSCQDIAVPRTSYRLRSQCNSVTKYVEKCRMVPVTSYRQVTMYQPVVSYYYPPSTSMYTPSGIGSPRIEEQRANPPQISSPGAENIPAPNVPVTPNNMSHPRAMPSKPEARNSSTFAWTASRKTGSLRGELVKNDQTTPLSNTKVIFLNAQDQTVRKDVRTNPYGEFDVQLPPGDWYVYIGLGNGKAEYYKKLTVKESDMRDLTLVSR